MLSRNVIEGLIDNVSEGLIEMRMLKLKLERLDLMTLDEKGKEVFPLEMK